MNVSPGSGSTIQNAVNAYPAGTAFCLGSGTFNITSAITPKTGDSFTGVYGAVLDASGWNTTDVSQGIFRAQNQDIDNVTIRNLVIRNSPERGIQAYKDYSDRWVIDHNEIYGNRFGIAHGNYFQVRDNYVHDNWQYGITGFRSTGSVIEHNEFAFNASRAAEFPGDSGTSKWAQTLNTTVRGNFVHDSYWTGIWFDGNSTGVLVEDNKVVNNQGNGIFHEVGGQAVIRNNTVTGSGERNIFISESHDTEIYGNVVGGSNREIVLFQDGTRIAESELGNDLIHDNTISVSTSGMAVTLTCTQMTSAQCSAYSTSKGIAFRGNSYVVPNLTSSWWYWNQASRTWNQWQGQGEDTTGTVNAS